MFDSDANKVLDSHNEIIEGSKKEYNYLKDIYRKRLEFLKELERRIKKHEDQFKKPNPKTVLSPLISFIGQEIEHLSDYKKWEKADSRHVQDMGEVLLEYRKRLIDFRRSLQKDRKQTAAEAKRKVANKIRPYLTNQVRDEIELELATDKDIVDLVS